MIFAAGLASKLEMFTMLEFMPFLHHVHSQHKHDYSTREAEE